MASTKFSYATSILIVKSTSSTCFSTTMPCVSGDCEPLTIANPIDFYDIMNKEQKEKQKTKQSHNKTNNKNSYLFIFCIMPLFFLLLWSIKDHFLWVGCGGCWFLFPQPLLQTFIKPVFHLFNFFVINVNYLLKNT